MGGLLGLPGGRVLSNCDVTHTRTAHFVHIVRRANCRHAALVGLMRGRPWELRRQVFWLQTVTVSALIAMVWITMVSRSRAQALRDATTAGLAAPGWLELVKLDLRSMLGIASLMLGVAIAGNALVTWRVRRGARGRGAQAPAPGGGLFQGGVAAGPGGGGPPGGGGRGPP